MNKKTQNHNIKHYWIFIDSLIDKYNFEECMNHKSQIKTLKPKITKKSVAGKQNLARIPKSSRETKKPQTS
jgi:hypothetical protein